MPKGKASLPLANVRSRSTQIVTDDLAKGTGDPIQVARFQWPGLSHPDHGLLLDDFQQDLIRSVFDPVISEVRIKGCAKAGKGAAAAIACCLWFAAYPESRIIITSQRFDHARDNLFGEISAWRKRMLEPGPGINHRIGIHDHERHYVAIANPESGEGFAGQHGPKTLFVFDEASSIPDEFYDIATTQATKIIALSNPRTLSGWFHRGFARHDPDKTQTVSGPFGRRRLITVDGADCRNVREGKEIIPSQITRDRFEGLLKHPNPRWVEVFAHGKFPSEDDQLQVILASWLSRHTGAWHKEIPVEAFGLDVAASSAGDETVLAVGGTHGVLTLHRWRHRDTMATVGRAIALAAGHGVQLTDGLAPVTVDADGLGVGVGHRLAEQGVRVIEHRGNASADNKSLYANVRAESYGELGRRLDPAGEWAAEPWALPDDPILLEELTAPEKVYASDGLRFRLTPKERQPGTRGSTIREKLGRSPDSADAVVYLFKAVREVEWQSGRFRQLTTEDELDMSWTDRLDEAVKALEGA